MNIKDYIFGEEIQTETIHHPIDDEKKIPKLSCTLAIYTKGKPMPNHADIVNIVDDHLLYESKNIYRDKPLFCNNKDIEDYINYYFKVYPDKHICIYFYVTQYEVQ